MILLHFSDPGKVSKHFLDSWEIGVPAAVRTIFRSVPLFEHITIISAWK